VLHLVAAPAELDVLDQWTPIATRSRTDRGRWQTLEGAPLSLKRALKLRDAGQLMQALRLDDQTETVMVRRPASNR
jgi:hypothetical protein